MKLLRAVHHSHFPTMISYPMVVRLLALFSFFFRPSYSGASFCICVGGGAYFVSFFYVFLYVSFWICDERLRADRAAAATLRRPQGRVLRPAAGGSGAVARTRRSAISRVADVDNLRITMRYTRGQGYHRVQRL